VFASRRGSSDRFIQTKQRLLHELLLEEQLALVKQVLVALLGGALLDNARHPIGFGHLVCAASDHVRQQVTDIVLAHVLQLFREDCFVMGKARRDVAKFILHLSAQVLGRTFGQVAVEQSFGRLFVSAHPMQHVCLFKAELLFESRRQLLNDLKSRREIALLDE